MINSYKVKYVSRISLALKTFCIFTWKGVPAVMFSGLVMRWVSYATVMDDTKKNTLPHPRR